MAKLVASTLKVDKLSSCGKQNEEGEEEKDCDPYISMKLKGIHLRVFPILLSAAAGTYQEHFTSVTRPHLGNNFVCQAFFMCPGVLNILYFLVHICVKIFFFARFYSMLGLEDRAGFLSYYCPCIESRCAHVVYDNTNTQKMYLRIFLSLVLTRYKQIKVLGYIR